MKRKFGKLGAMLLAVILLVGMFSTTALADVTSLPDNTSPRVLNIYKYSPIDAADTAGDGTAETLTGKVPLGGVEFDVYKVPASQTTSATPTTGEVTAIAVAANFKRTMVTGDGTGTSTLGLASWPIATGNAEDGIYLVVEKDNAAVQTKADPFYVSMPLTNPDQGTWMYTVNVYPKNTVTPGPEVNKDVDAIDTKNATHDVGDIETWIIRGDVPADLYRTVNGGTEVYAKNYAFSDALSPQLTYKGNIVVKLLTKAGTEIDVAATNYDTTGTSAVDTAGGTLALKLNNTGMKWITQNLGTGTTKPEIRVSFDTVINDTAAVATAIPNNVTLNYTNSANNQYDPTEVPAAQRPEVHMGGLEILKHRLNAEATTLNGAKFKIARDATAAEIADGTITKETIRVNNVVHTVVFVDFYQDTAITAPAVTEVTTANGGKAVLYGLAYGTYYLVETAAPSGYNLLSAPVEVTVSATSHQTASVIKVANSQKFVLPATGGNGTMLFTAGGILLIGLAIILIFTFCKKKRPTK